MTELIITEYTPPTGMIVELSEQLQSLPQPLCAIGEIVIVPGQDGKPIYAVVSLICALRDAFPNELVYGVVCELNPLGLTYMRESLVVKRENNNSI
jgi:hypothetical protein